MHAEAAGSIGQIVELVERLDAVDPGNVRSDTS